MVSLIASGYFSLDRMEGAAVDLHIAIRSLGSRAGEHVTLYDLRDVKVMAGPALDRFTRYFNDAAMKPLWARRVAFVHTSALLGRQLQRMLREHMAIFTDRKEATAWLLADQDRPRTISHPTAASG